MITNGPIFNQIKSKSENNIRQIAVLIDPDKIRDKKLEETAELIEQSNADYIFVGGSCIFSDIDKCVEIIKLHSNKPVILFPGSHLHISQKADAILLLSLISGRNPEYLIGNHISAVPKLYDSKLEIISTAYILIDGGKQSSVQYVSNTQPIPADKTDIVISTAIAGEMTGNKLIYLEAGSGAINPVPDIIISEVNKFCNIPLIVGGGIKNSNETDKKHNAGANIIVIGSAIEENPEILKNL